MPRLLSSFFFLLNFPNASANVYDDCKLYNFLRPSLYIFRTLLLCSSKHREQYRDLAIKLLRNTFYIQNLITLKRCDFKACNKYHSLSLSLFLSLPFFLLLGQLLHIDCILILTSSAGFGEFACSFSLLSRLSAGEIFRGRERERERSKQAVEYLYIKIELLFFPLIEN